MVIITGAAGGIGSAMCRVFAENGASVAACDINEAGCSALRDEIINNGGKAEAFYLDVTDRKGLVSAAENIIAKFSAADVLINNAGVNAGPADRKLIHMRQCAFTAAKAGVINFTKAMAVELAAEEIRVNCFHP